jgi:hypothetical protein
MDVSLQTEIQGKFDILVAFCETLVYKDEYEANKYETDVSMQQSALYNSNCSKVVVLVVSNRINTSLDIWSSFFEYI